MRLIKRVDGIWDSMKEAFICWRYRGIKSYPEENKVSFETTLNIFKISIDFKITKNK